MSDQTDPIEGIDEIVGEFLVEGHEHLERFDRAVLELATRPGAEAALGTAFRALHTVKGTCGFLGFATLESVAHAAEGVLGRLRDGELALTTDVVGALLATGGALRDLLATIEATGADGDDDRSALIERLHRAQVPAPPGPTGDVAGDLVVTHDQIARIVDDHLGQSGPCRTRPTAAGVARSGVRPVGAAWNRVPCLVRELAGRRGKRVRVEVEGAGTELDRTVVEAIRDPLTHLARNAVDHGVEPPAARLAAGKDPEGVLRLRASYGGGCVHLEVTDDGGGVDVGALRRKAVEKGLLPPEVAARMADRDALDLMFTAGLSTAEVVTTVSGRGVGLDVVRTDVAAIGGTVDVRTAVGVGTSFRITIPRPAA